MTIDKGLSFRLEATPNEGIRSKGLSLKVKVRNKQDAGTQYDTILKIKNVGTNDKTIHLVRSEQTMTSFEMLVENQKTEIKKSSFFRNFRPGGCLDPPLDEDKQKYTTAPTVKSSPSKKDSKKKCKQKYETTCVQLKQEDKVHPFDKSSSASVLSLFKDISASCLNSPSSNTIITYPTHVKRSKESTTSSKKSIDEKRKKSFSQTAELYFKPKSDETEAKSKVSKKKFYREGNRSVNSSDMLYIQDAAKAQMQNIQQYPNLNELDVKSFHNKSQPVLVSDVKIPEDEIIADFNNNKKNEMLSGRSTTLSDTILKQINNNTITLDKDKDNKQTAPIPISTATGLTVAGLTATGLTSAIIKQPQNEETINESDFDNVEGRKEDQLIVASDEKLQRDLKDKNEYSNMLDDKMITETPKTESKSGIPKLDAKTIVKGEGSQDDINNSSFQQQQIKDVLQPESTKDKIDNVSIQPQIINDLKQAEGTRDHIETMENVEKLTPLTKEASIKDMKSTSILSKHYAIMTTRQEPGDSNKVLDPTEKSFIAAEKVTYTDDKDKLLLFEEIAKPPLSVDESIKDMEAKISTSKFGQLNSLNYQLAIESKSKDKEDSNKYYTELKAGSEQVKETKHTMSESSRQEHDNVTPIFDYPVTGKGLTSLSYDPNNVPINKDFKESLSNLGQTSGLSQSKNSSVLALAKDLTEQTKVVTGSRVSSQSQIRKMPFTDINIATKVMTSPHGSNKSLKSTREENKSSTLHIAPNVFPLHKATSSHSSQHGDFPNTGPPLNTSSDSDQQTYSQMKTALVADVENNVMPDANSAVISIAKRADIESQLAFELKTELPFSKSSIASLLQKTENNLISLLDGTSSLLNTTVNNANTFVEGSLAGSQIKAVNLESSFNKTSFDKDLNPESLSKFLQDPISEELRSLDKYIREAESQHDNVVVSKKSSDVIVKVSKESVHHKLGSTLLQKPLAGKVEPTEKPVPELAMTAVTVASSIRSIKDYLKTSKNGSKASIDKTAQTENIVLNYSKTSAETAKDVLRAGMRSLGGSITTSLAPSIDIDQTDQFLVDIAFKFSRNGAAKQTIIKSVDAESGLSQLSGINNIISHKSTTSKPFEHPIEIAINPKYNILLKLDHHKQKWKTEKKHSKLNFDITSKLSNKVKKHSSIESNMRRKGMDLNIVLETIHKEQLQPLEINLKKLKAEIIMLSKEQAYIQRSIYNLSEKRSCPRFSRVKRSLSCLSKRHI